jgi:hypothetical protein
VLYGISSGLILKNVVERISDFEIFDQHADRALSGLKNRLDEGFPVEFQV